jgi:hypothetical protein
MDRNTTSGGAAAATLATGIKAEKYRWAWPIVQSHARARGPTKANQEPQLGSRRAIPCKSGILPPSEWQAQPLMAPASLHLKSSGGAWRSGPLREHPVPPLLGLWRGQNVTFV